MGRLHSGWCAPALFLLSYVVCTLSLTCPSPARPLPPNSCLLEHSLPTTTWVGGRDQCVAMGQDGLAVITNEQFDNLKLYAEVLGRADDLYWLGYIYDSLGQLQDRFMNNLPGDSVLLMEGNFAATDGEGEVAAGQGVCVAIGGDKMLHRRSCRELHASLCQRVIEAPFANITTSSSEAGTSLTCTTSNVGPGVIWLAGSPPLPIDNPESNPIVVTEGQRSAYYCVVENELGGFVSDPVILPDPNSGAEAPSVTITASDPPFTFGSTLTLSCDFSGPGDNVQWFINGTLQEESSSNLMVEMLRDEGYYQCFVGADMGLIGSASLLVEAQPGTPEAVDDITAEPNTRDELFVSWLCPLVTNTHDGALLRYNILYHTGRTFMTSMALMEEGVVPVLLNEAESEDCVVEAVLPVTDPGTYVVKVVAVASGMQGDESDNFAVATTYGTAPPVVKGLTVTRDPDNKQVQSRWEPVETAPPVGVVVLYQIQYRDSKGSIMTVFRSSKFTSVVLNNVIDANSYEVRVSAGVVVQRDPVEYEYSNFTEWVTVSGIMIFQPTQEGLNTSPPSELSTTSAAIVVGVLVGILIIAILGMGIFCCIYKGMDPESLDKEKTATYRLREVSAEGEEQKLSD